MTIVSDDPTWWPTIDAYRFSSYFVAAASVGIAYDWGEHDKIKELLMSYKHFQHSLWDKRSNWSGLYMLISVPTISLTDTECRIVYLVWSWTGMLVYTMLWVIVITRLYAMYQRSRKILIFLIVTALAIEIFDGVGAIMMTTTASGEQLILSGTYQCSVGYAEDIVLLGSIGWILSTVWEVLTLCLAAWIAVKHFRGLRQHSTGGIVRDCFTVLIKTHVLYFASSVAISCFQLIVFLPTFLTDQFSPEIQVYYGVLQIFTVVQTFVLGPRLILGVREFHAKLVADSDAATAMTSIAFQERVHISTGNGV